MHLEAGASSRHAYNNEGEAPSASDCKEDVGGPLESLGYKDLLVEEENGGFDEGEGCGSYDKACYESLNITIRACK